MPDGGVVGAPFIFILFLLYFLWEPLFKTINLLNQILQVALENMESTPCYTFFQNSDLYQRNILLDFVGINQFEYKKRQSGWGSPRYLNYETHL